MRGDCYSPPAHEVTRRETHMSEVFLADGSAYKLKKPVPFSLSRFLDTRSPRSGMPGGISAQPPPGRRRLSRRGGAGVFAVPASPSAAPGQVVDWLVVMNRLDDAKMLDRVIAEHRLHRWQLDRVAAVLVQFYRRASAVFISPKITGPRCGTSLAYNRRVLLDPRFDLPAGAVRHSDAVQRRFLAERGALIAARVRARCIVDGHGDLRPEHIWLGDPVRIIDCLEFNAGLRMVDPLDELAFLCVECERLGAAWAGEYLRRRIAHALHDGHADELFLFYRCHRATLRARLAIAHLLEARAAHAGEMAGVGARLSADRGDARRRAAWSEALRKRADR